MLYVFMAGAVMAQTADESQFVTQVVSGNVVSERVVRGADEYPSTLRELKEKGFEVCPHHVNV